MATLRYRVLAQSPAVRDTLRALGRLAGMAVKLAPFDPHADQPVLATGTIPLCRLILGTPEGEAACRRFLARLQRRFRCRGPRAEGRVDPQSRLSAKAKRQPLRTLRIPHSAFCTQTCFAGLTEVVAPITAQGRLVGALLCGEVFRSKPTQQDFQRCRRRLRALGIRLEPRHARRAYFQTPLASPARIWAVRRLLAGLAAHLGEMAAHCLVARLPADPPCVTCAKVLVAKHLGETCAPTARPGRPT